MESLELDGHWRLQTEQKMTTKRAELWRGQEEFFHRQQARTRGDFESISGMGGGGGRVDIERRRASVDTMQAVVVTSAHVVGTTMWAVSLWRRDSRSTRII